MTLYSIDIHVLSPFFSDKEIFKEVFIQEEMLRRIGVLIFLPFVEKLAKKLAFTLIIVSLNAKSYLDFIKELFFKNNLNTMVK